LLAETAPEAQPGNTGDFAREVVTRAMRKLEDMGEFGTASTRSDKYLPKLAKQYKLLDRLTERDFANTMRAMRSDGLLINRVVGQYSNRSPREGLALAQVHE